MQTIQKSNESFQTKNTLTSINVDDIKGLSLEQKDKIKSLFVTIDSIIKELSKHIATNEPAVLAMSNEELIIGSAQLVFEDRIMKEEVVRAMEIQPQKQQIVTADYVKKKEPTYH